MNKHDFFFGFTKKFWISAVILLVLLWLFVNKVGSLVMLPFGFSLVVAYIFNSFADKISHITSISKSIISFFIVLLLFTLLIIFCITFIPVAIRNIYIILHFLPTFANTLQEHAFFYIPQSIQKTIIDSYSQFDSIIPKLTQKVFAEFGNISSIFTQVFSFFVITPITSYYMIKDWSTINNNIVSLIPQRHREIFISIRTEIRKRLAGYLVGQIYIILFLSSFYGIALFLADLEFGFTIGILTGIASIVPYIGLSIGFSVAIMVTFLKGKSLIYIGVIIGIFIVGQIIEGSFLTPKLMSNKIQIHPLWVIFGFLVSGIFFGFFGVIFALPLTAITSVLIKFYVNNYYKKRCI